MYACIRRVWKHGSRGDESRIAFSIVLPPGGLSVYRLSVYRLWWYLMQFRRRRLRPSPLGVAGVFSSVLPPASAANCKPAASRPQSPHSLYTTPLKA